MKFRLDVLLLAVSFSAVLISLLRSRMEFEVYATAVHLGLLMAAYYLSAAKKYSVALLILGSYLALWAATLWLGVPQLSREYSAAGLEEAAYPRSELLIEQGVSSFQNVRSPCACLLTIDVIKVSPIGAHGGWGGTECYLWLFGGGWKMGEILHRSIN